MELYRKTGWFYIPASFLGLMITSGLLSIAAFIFYINYRQYDSMAETMIASFPYLTACFLIHDWVGRNSHVE